MKHQENGCSLLTLPSCEHQQNGCSLLTLPSCEASTGPYSPVSHQSGNSACAVWTHITQTPASLAISHPANYTGHTGIKTNIHHKSKSDSLPIAKVTLCLKRIGEKNSWTDQEGRNQKGRIPGSWWSMQSDAASMRWNQVSPVLGHPNIMWQMKNEKRKKQLVN